MMPAKLAANKVGRTELLTQTYLEDPSLQDQSICQLLQADKAYMQSQSHPLQLCHLATHARDACTHAAAG